MAHPSASTVTMAVIYRCGNAVAMPLTMERGRDDWNLDYNLRFMLSSRLGVRPNDISYVDYSEGVALKEAVSSLCNDARDELVNSRSFVVVGVDLLQREHDRNRPQTGPTGAVTKRSYQVSHENPHTQNSDMNLLLEKFNKLEANLNRLENSMTKSIVSHVTDILTDKDRLQETKLVLDASICNMGDSIKESAVRNLNLVCPPSETYACKSPTDASSISDVEIIASPSECGDYFEVVDRPDVLGSSCSYYNECSMNGEGFVPEPKLLNRLPNSSSAARAAPMPSGPLNLVVSESVLEPAGAVASTRSVSEDGSATEVPEGCSVIGDVPSMTMLPVLSDLASVSSARLARLVQMLRAELQLGGDQLEVDDRPAEVLWKLCGDPRGPRALINALRALLGEIPRQGNDEHDLTESVDARALFLALNSVSQLPGFVNGMSMVASSFSSEATASAFENISASQSVYKSLENAPVFVDPTAASGLCQEAMAEGKISAPTAVVEDAGVPLVVKDSEIPNVVESDTSPEHQLLEAAVMDDGPKTGDALNSSDEPTPLLCTAGGDVPVLGAAAQAQNDVQEGDYEGSIASASRRVLDWLRRVTDHTRPVEGPAETDPRVGAITTLVDMGFSDIDQMVGLMAKHGHQDLLPIINELLDQQLSQN